VRIRAGARLPVCIKRVEVLGGTDDELLELPLGHVRAGECLQRLDALVERALRRFDGHPAPDLQGVLLAWQIQLAVQGMQTGRAVGAVPRARHGHRPEDRFQRPLLHGRRRPRHAVRIAHRCHGVAGLT